MQALHPKKMDDGLRISVAGGAVLQQVVFGTKSEHPGEVTVAGNEDALERQLKRQALQLASMLPDDPNAAVKVLGYAYELIEDFVRPSRPALNTKSTGGPLRLVAKDGAPVKP